MTPKAVDAAFKRSFLPVPYLASINSYLIVTPDKVVLIDTGAGTLMAEFLGLMLQSLRASGHLPEEVTEIDMTHLHEDHESGLTSESKRVFPNATLFAHPKDAEFWLTSGEAKSALQQPKPGDDAHTKFMNTHYKHTSQMLTPYVDAGRFRTVATISV